MQLATSDQSSLSHQENIALKASHASEAFDDLAFLTIEKIELSISN